MESTSKQAPPRKAKPKTKAAKKATKKAIAKNGAGKTKVEIYKDRKGEFRWTLRHGNGRIIGASSEGYKRRAGATNNFQSLVKAAKGKIEVISA